MGQFSLLQSLLSIPAILIGFAFHEYAHAKVADKLGDKTPRFEGRLTLNPLAHIDIIGFLMIVFVQFGWAKPVRVNKRAFKNYYKDDLKVSIAGPLANLVVAFVAIIIMAIYEKYIFYRFGGNLFAIIDAIMYWTVMININLFVFNLLPLPGLDGLSILEDLSPKTFYKISGKIYEYQFLILIFVLVVGARILSIPTSVIYSLFKTISYSLIF